MEKHSLNILPEGSPTVELFQILLPGNEEYKSGVNFASGGAGALIQTFQGYEIYKNGGRKFGFLKLLELGFLPSVRALEQTNSRRISFKEASTQMQLHNKALPKTLKDLKKELGGFKYSIFDLYTSTSERVNDPLKYGFKNGKSACCGGGPFRGIEPCGLIKDYELCENPGDYLFFDGNHPTEIFNNQIAKLMWSGNSKFTSPYNLKPLLVA
ncbi:GDSL esterase/lipase 1-like isoform X2 [Mercurialis annua]|uniref:GDSL esterase/lipase 1-like isoform X2 n=1 Tax=Mercurialis annua TaxID=3986 RepID=UPI0024AD6C83|nr:GDSL esterase/lipase 1-like isoform X2 [Mercurialis annua]